MQAKFHNLRRLALALGLGLIGALVLTALAAPPRTALADAPWGNSVRVTDDYDPNMPQDYAATAVASTGVVYAVWADGRDYYEVLPVYFARSTDGGQTWSKNIPITTQLMINEGGWPAVAASGPKDVHVVWGSYENDFPRVFYSHSGDSGETWSVPRTLDQLGEQGGATQPDVATDGGDHVYVVWVEYDGLYLAHSADGGAKWAVTPSPVITSTGWLNTPALAVDATGALHLVWQEMIPESKQAVCYARSADHGDTWTTPHCFDSPVALLPQALPDVAVNRLNANVHVVWEQNDGNYTAIYHALSSDGGNTWGTPQSLSEAGYYATWPAVAVNSTGLAYVVWEQGLDVPEIYYAQSSDGVLWSTPSRVNDAWRGTTHYRPAIAAGDTPHVLWTLEDAQGVKDIYATALATPEPVTIPASDGKVTLDGQCGARTEYANALAVEFSDFGYTRTVYLQHDGTNLYVCMDAFHGWFDQDRAGVVYLDTDGARETQAEADDYALKVNFMEGTLGAQSSWFGSSNPANPYSPTNALLGWTGVATYTGVIGQTGADVAEYRIPMTLTGGLCGAPFGLAVYHQGYQSVYFTPFGWPSNQFYDEPRTWQMAYYGGAPCPDPTHLPVFKLQPPKVTPEDAQDLANRLEGITTTEVLTGDTHTGTGRLLVADPGHGTQLELFTASGGLLASNPGLAFGQGAPMDPNAGNPSRLACQFLLLNGLFNSQTPDFAKNCNNPATLGYNLTLIKQTMFTPPSALAAATAAPEEIIGVVVQVPVGVEINTFETPIAQGNAPQLNPQPEPPAYFMPYDGPGGHLSLIFLSTDPASTLPSLDSSVPGLGALAAPAFGRQMQEFGVVEIVSRAQATQQALARVQQSMPQAVNIELGTPELVYYLGDPAAPQSVVLPMWAFNNVSATIGGEVAAVRGFYVPAVEGMTPLVTIVTPVEGAVHPPFRPLTVTATIAEGTAPYTYTLSSDDGTVLREGVTGSALTLPNVMLPGIRSGEPVSLTLRLDATDSNGVTGWSVVNLQPIIINVYLPLVVRNFTEGSITLSLPRPTAPLANYDVGVEWVGDYPPLGAGGSDIPMTVPDANGFYNQLRGYGWGHAIKYGETSAWEKDWRDCSLGGIDCSSGVESAEFMYFAGHGSPARIYFSSNKDSNSFYGANARYQNTRWIGFASCQTLRAGPYVGPGNPPLTYWFNAFQGAHMLLGFHSNMADIAFGGPLGYNLQEHCFLWWCSQLTIREAWVKTAFDMNAGKPAYLYAIGTNGVNPVNNKLPKGNGTLLSRPFPAASFHWVWWD
ncbi:MAG TPA: DUF6345 domain-containing protein [Anaerolineae bacterium]|nr:DUF6345 domain-containing protein [Anaerolineae bacterium]HQI83063.1 DUF6345 domain-containing protein [Anaerolineae bacterium]